MSVLEINLLKADCVMYEVKKNPVTYAEAKEDAENLFLLHLSKWMMEQACSQKKPWCFLLGTSVHTFNTPDEALRFSDALMVASDLHLGWLQI